jgi:hypothetical protein
MPESEWSVLQLRSLTRLKVSRQIVCQVYRSIKTRKLLMARACYWLALGTANEDIQVFLYFYSSN